MLETTALENWGDLKGKTIKRITLHNFFNRDAIAIIFSDKTYALLESSAPNSIISLIKKPKLDKIR